MAVIAAALRELISAGLEGEALVAAIARIEESMPATTSSPSEADERRREKARARTQRWRGNQNRDVTEHHETSQSVTERHETSQEPPPSPEEMSPTPPKTQPLPTSQKEPPKGVSKKGSELPDDWRLSDEYRSAAEQIGLVGAEVGREAEKFRDYWRAKSGTDRLKRDWLATWRNWCRNCVERRSSRAPPRQAEQTTNVWLEAAERLTNGSKNRDYPSESYPTDRRDAGFVDEDCSVFEPSRAPRESSTLLDLKPIFSDRH